MKVSTDRHAEDREGLRKIFWIPMATAVALVFTISALTT